MVKIYTVTDRTHRYHVRNNRKNINELHSIIQKKNVEIDNYRTILVKNTNTISRTNGFNRFLYNTYSELYNKYNTLMSDINGWKSSLQNAEKCIHEQSETIKNMNKELDETKDMYDNLEELYNEKVTECERLKNNNNVNLEEKVNSEENDMNFNN